MASISAVRCCGQAWSQQLPCTFEGGAEGVPFAFAASDWLEPRQINLLAVHDIGVDVVAAGWPKVAVHRWVNGPKPLAKKTSGAIVPEVLRLWLLPLQPSNQAFEREHIRLRFSLSAFYEHLSLLVLIRPTAGHSGEERQ